MESTQQKWQIFKYKKQLDTLWKEYDASTTNRDAMIQFDLLTSVVVNYKDVINTFCQKGIENEQDEAIILQELPIEGIFSYTDELLKILVQKCHLFGVKMPIIFELILLFLRIPNQRQKIIGMLDEDILDAILKIIPKIAANTKILLIFTKILLEIYPDFSVEPPASEELPEKEKKNKAQEQDEEGTKEDEPHEEQKGDQFGSQFWKMAKRVKGIFGFKKEEQKEEDFMDKSLSEALSGKRGLDQAERNFDEIQQCIHNFLTLHDQRTAIFEMVEGNNQSGVVCILAKYANKKRDEDKKEEGARTPIRHSKTMPQPRVEEVQKSPSFIKKILLQNTLRFLLSGCKRYNGLCYYYFKKLFSLADCTHTEEISGSNGKYLIRTLSLEEISQEIVIIESGVPDSVISSSFMVYDGINDCNFDCDLLKEEDDKKFQYFKCEKEDYSSKILMAQDSKNAILSTEPNDLGYYKDLIKHCMFLVQHYSCFENKGILSHFLHQSFENVDDYMRKLILDWISKDMQHKSYKLQDNSYQVDDQFEVETTLFSLFNLFTSVISGEKVLPEEDYATIYELLVQSIYHLSFVKSCNLAPILRDLPKVLACIDPNEGEGLQNLQRNCIYLISILIRLFCGVGNKFGSITDLKTQETEIILELVKVLDTGSLNEELKLCLLSHCYLYTTHTHPDSPLILKLVSKYIEQSVLQESDLCFVIFRRFYLQSGSCDFTQFLKEIMQILDLEFGNFRQEYEELQKKGQVLEEGDLVNGTLVSEEVYRDDVDYTNYFLQLLKYTGETFTSNLNIPQNFQSFLIEILEFFDISSENYNAVLRFLFDNLSQGIRRFDDCKFQSNFMKQKVNSLFLEHLLEGLKKSSFSVKTEFPATPDSLSLGSFLSEREAVAALSGKIYEAGRFASFPSIKNGFTCIFAFKMKRLYENMMLLTFINKENKPIFEIWYNCEREFLEYEKVEEFLKDLENPDHEGEGRNSYLEYIETSPYILNHSFEIKFNGDFEGHKILCKSDNFLKVGEVAQFGFILNKTDLVIYLNGKEVGTTKPEALKDTPSRACFQAVDKTLSSVSIFEGVFTPEVFDEVFSSGESYLHRLEILPCIKSIKNTKLFCKFPCNLKNVNISTSYKTKIEICKESEEQIDIKSCGKQANIKISPITQKDFYELDMPLNSQKKKAFVENLYKYPVSYTPTLKEYLSNLEYFALLTGILEENKDIEILTITCDILAQIIVKNPDFYQNVPEEVMCERFLKISRRYCSEDLYIPNFTDLLFKILSDTYTLPDDFQTQRTGQSYNISPPKSTFLPFLFTLSKIPKNDSNPSQPLFYPILESLALLLSNKPNFQIFLTSVPLKTFFSCLIHFPDPSLLKILELYLSPALHSSTSSAHVQIYSSIINFLIFLTKFPQYSQLIGFCILGFMKEITKKLLFFLWAAGVGKEEVIKMAEALIRGALVSSDLEIMELILEMVKVAGWEMGGYSMEQKGRILELVYEYVRDMEVVSEGIFEVIWKIAVGVGVSKAKILKIAEKQPQDVLDLRYCGEVKEVPPESIQENEVTSVVHPIMIRCIIENIHKLPENHQNYCEKLWQRINKIMEANEKVSSDLLQHNFLQSWYKFTLDTKDLHLTS
ncbi:unnamed protein product [Moneuplotes crassus]|uniref:Beige/BEACH domain containing protein n=1 Tax=Euplotes crassus TaxID=5936 RepID=A0AAD1X6N7_EUPCR|nr:unnamed protein product [Moneuplotes crassus]